MALTRLFGFGVIPPDVAKVAQPTYPQFIVSLIAVVRCLNATVRFPALLTGIRPRQDAALDCARHSHSRSAHRSMSFWVGGAFLPTALTPVRGAFHKPTFNSGLSLLGVFAHPLSMSHPITFAKRLIGLMAICHIRSIFRSALLGITTQFAPRCLAVWVTLVTVEGQMIWL